MEIKFIEENKDIFVEPILRSLPEWFGIEESTQAYINGVKDKPLWVAFENEKPIGFISLKKHFKKSYEVYIMGLYPDFHGRGIGKRLLNDAETYLKDLDVELLQVKTLSDSSPDKNYGNTRHFYLSCGFEPLEEFKTLWDEWNPCLLLIKKLK